MERGTEIRTRDILLGSSHEAVTPVPIEVCGIQLNYSGEPDDHLSAACWSMRWSIDFPVSHYHEMAPHLPAGQALQVVSPTLGAHVNRVLDAPLGRVLRPRPFRAWSAKSHQAVRYPSPLTDLSG